MNKRKSKGKELKDWILRDVIPRGVNKLMEEEHQKAIEEKDTQLALLSDNCLACSCFRARARCLKAETRSTVGERGEELRNNYHCEE